MNTIFAVSFNSAGGWDRSQSFRVTAQTSRFMAAVAVDWAVDHADGHRPVKHGWWKPGERVVISRADIEEDQQTGEIIF